MRTLQRLWSMSRPARNLFWHPQVRVMPIEDGRWGVWTFRNDLAFMLFKRRFGVRF